MFRSRLTAAVVLFLLTVGVFWKLVLTRQYTFYDSPDLAYQVAPWMQAQAAAFHRGEILLWDPYVAAGQSLIGQVQPATAFPLSWLLFLAPLRNGFVRMSALHWYFVLLHYIAALAGYALCRDLRRSRTASILGASAFAFGAYVGSNGWPQMVNAAVWGPLTLMFSLRAMRGESPRTNAILSGAFLGLQWLGGHHQIPIFTTLAISALWVFHMVQGKTARLRVSRAVLYGALVAMMVAAGALQLFPAFSYGHTAVRWVSASHALRWDEPVPYSVHDEFGLSPYSVLGIFMNGAFTNSNPFVGIVVLFLAIAGILLARGDPVVRLLAGLAAGGLIFAFSSFTILHGILYAIVPFVEKARMPAAAVFVFQLGICPLAAFGLDGVTAAWNTIWIRRAAIAVSSIAVLLWIFVAFGAAAKVAMSVRVGEVALTAFVAALLAWLLASMGNGTVAPRTGAICLVVLMMLELGNLAGHDWQNRDVGWHFWPLLTRDRDVAEFLKTRPTAFRVDVNGNDVPYNFGDWYGIETYFGYVASAPEAFMRVFGEQRTRSLLGVQYYIAKAPMRPDQHEVFAGDSGIKIFEALDPMPRTWTAHEITRVSDPRLIAPTLNAIDFRRTTFLDGDAPTLETCTGDRATLVAHHPQSAIVDVDMNCRGMLVLGDAYSQDWVATIDGRPVRDYAAYTILQGVVAEAGHHRVEFKYRPVSVYFGAVLTAAAFLLAVSVWLHQRRTYRRA